MQKSWLKLKNTIISLRRAIEKPSPTSTWINTNVIWDKDGNIEHSEGYWYDGKLALAHAAANLDQDSYAFYSDGTESGSVIIGVKNASQTLTTDTIYLARFLVQEDGGGSSNNLAPQLEYDLNNSGTFTSVTDVSSVVQSIATANIVDASDTTQRLGAGTFITPNAGFDEVDGIAGAVSFVGNDETEFLYSIQIISADVTDADTIQLRAAGLDTYTNTGAATVDKPAAAVDHVATASLSAQTATISGTSSVIKTHDAAGTLSAQNSVMTGTAERVAAAVDHVATGSLLAQSANIAGTALRDQTHDASGALSSQDAVVSGAANRSTGAVTHVATGALLAQTATITGTALRDKLHAATGVLVAQSSVISGTALRDQTHDASGSLSAQSAFITGTSSVIRIHNATGALVAQSSIISGAALRGTLPIPTTTWHKVNSGRVSGSLGIANHPSIIRRY